MEYEFVERERGGREQNGVCLSVSKIQMMIDSSIR